MSIPNKDTDNDSFPEESNLDDKTVADVVDGSDKEEDSEMAPEENLYDLMADFLVNENGENLATVLTNIQGSIDQNSKCILKLTKVIQDYLASQTKK